MVKPLLIFDVMIIYDAHLANSAADSTYHEFAPFFSTGEYFNCNVAYSYFIRYCKQQGLRAALTTTHDINAAGQCSSAWTYTTQWKRYLNTSTANVIFDKFSNLIPRNHAAYEFLTRAIKKVPLYHNQAMRMLFDNKLETYQRFPSFCIPTVKVGLLTKANFAVARKTLHEKCRNHPYQDDFTTDVVLKDQFGIGGSNIFKITDDDLSTIPANSSLPFILQPLIQASGFTIAQHTGNTDLRVILCNNSIVQSYLRVAKAGEFRANALQGGTVVYLTLDQIPAEVLQMVTAIKRHLPSKTALYTLDFIKSKNGHVYFIEGNNSPGLNWFNDEDEKRAKHLIRFIVKNLQLTLTSQVL